MNTNILITSAGKRVALVNYFKETLKEFFPDSMVFTTDMNPNMAPAGYVSDCCIKVPRVTDDNYPDILNKICIENGIGMIVPTIDTELLVLSKIKKHFAEQNISVIVSDEKFVQSCRDKRETQYFFETNGIKVPQKRDIEYPVFPIFAKPYDGSLSTNLHIIRSYEDITSSIKEDKKLIFMELIDKTVYKEYTVDMYYGIDHKVKCIIPRERISVRAGEINQGKTQKNYIIDFLKEKLNYIEGCVGCICIQLFYDDKTHDIIAIEINPRFGGGFPLSYVSGGNFPASLIKEHFLHQEIEYYDGWKDGLIMLRYDDAIFV